MTRTAGQFGGGLGVGLALALLVVWVLNRTIGLSPDEINLLGPVLSTLFGGIGAYIAPFVPVPQARRGG